MKRGIETAAFLLPRNSSYFDTGDRHSYSYGNTRGSFRSSPFLTHLWFLFSRCPRRTGDAAAFENLFVNLRQTRRCSHCDAVMRPGTFLVAWDGAMKLFTEILAEIPFRGKIQEIWNYVSQTNVFWRGNEFVKPFNFYLWRYYPGIFITNSWRILEIQWCNSFCLIKLIKGIL